MCLTAMMVRPCFSSETLLSTLNVRSRSADGGKRLDNNSNTMLWARRHALLSDKVVYMIRLY